MRLTHQRGWLSGFANSGKSQLALKFLMAYGWKDPSLSSRLFKCILKMGKVPFLLSLFVQMFMVWNWDSLSPQSKILLCIDYFKTKTFLTFLEWSLWNSDKSEQKPRRMCVLMWNCTAHYQSEWISSISPYLVVPLCFVPYDPFCPTFNGSPQKRIHDPNSIIWFIGVDYLSSRTPHHRRCLSNWIGFMASSGFAWVIKRSHLSDLYRCRSNSCRLQMKRGATTPEEHSVAPRSLLKVFPPKLDRNR